MDAVRAAPVQEVRAQREDHHGRLPCAQAVAARRHVLQELRRRRARLPHAFEKPFDVSGFQRPLLRGNAPRLLEVVERAQGRTVAQVRAHVGQPGEEDGVGNVFQPLASEAPRDRAHVGGNGRVLVRVDGVVASAVHQAERIAARLPVEGDGLDARQVAREVEGRRAALRAGQLVLHAAGLPEVGLLDLSALQRQRHGVARHGARRVAQHAQQHADQHLERGRRRDPGACGDVGAGGRIEPGKPSARAHEGGRHAAHERKRRPALAFARVQVAAAQRDVAEALHAHAHLVGAVRGGERVDAAVDCGRDRAPALMVGMVAGQLHAPGSGCECERPCARVPEALGEPLAQARRRRSAGILQGRHRASSSAGSASLLTRRS